VHIATGTWWKQWNKARVGAGRPDLRLHDLRHTAGTRFTQRGATLKEVMALLGHSTSTAALRYQQADDERMTLLASRMSPDFME